MSLSEVTWRQQLDCYDSQIEMHKNSVKIYCILLRKSLIDRQNWILGKAVITPTAESQASGSLDMTLMALTDKILQLCEINAEEMDKMIGRAQVEKKDTVKISKVESTITPPAISKESTTEDPMYEDTAHIIEMRKKQLKKELERENISHREPDIQKAQDSAEEIIDLSHLVSDDEVSKKTDTELHEIAEQSYTYSSGLSKGIEEKNNVIKLLDEVLSDGYEVKQAPPLNKNDHEPIQITVLHRMSEKERQMVYLNAHLDAISYVDENYPGCDKETRLQKINEKGDELLQEFINKNS